MSTVRYYLLGAFTSFSGSNPSQINFTSTSRELDRTDAFVRNGIWINGYSDKYLDLVNRVDVGDMVAIKSTNRNQGTLTIKAIGIVNQNYEDGRRLGVDWDPDFEPFDVPFGGGKYTHTISEVTNQDHIDQIWDHQNSEPPIIKIQRFGDSPPEVTDDNKSKGLIKRFNDYDDQNSQEPVVNSFATALLVLGDSGAGKSTLIDSLLEKENHEFEFIIPTSTTTSLLAQFQPSKSKYVISRLGKLILEAVDNPHREYTAVFDEMHKSIVIEMVNDELLQAISLERNQGRRFISVDGEIARLYKDKLDNLNIPQNFGFIFITSNPKILKNNPDLIRRVRVVRINKGDSSKINTIDDLLNLSVPGKDYEP